MCINNKCGSISGGSIVRINSASAFAHEIDTNVLMKSASPLSLNRNKMFCYTVMIE